MGCSSSKSTRSSLDDAQPPLKTEADPRQFPDGQSPSPESVNLPPDEQSSTPKSSKSGDIRTRNSLVSPLLRLPPEIRNKIYNYVIGNPLIKPFAAGGLSTIPGYHFYYYDIDRSRLHIYYWNSAPTFQPRVCRLMTLNYVCRQLRSETQNLVLTKAIFGLQYQRSMGAAIAKLSKQQRAIIKSVAIDEDVLDWDYTYEEPVPFPNLRHVFIIPTFMRIPEDWPTKYVEKAEEVLGVGRGLNDACQFIVTARHCYLPRDRCDCGHHDWRYDRMRLEDEWLRKRGRVVPPYEEVD